MREGGLSRSEGRCVSRKRRYVRQEQSMKKKRNSKKSGMVECVKDELCDSSEEAKKKEGKTSGMRYREQ